MDFKALRDFCWNGLEKKKLSEISIFLGARISSAFALLIEKVPMGEHAHVHAAKRLYIQYELNDIYVAVVAMRHNYKLFN